ncbi:MAG: CPBP family intramembrane glutamic endopeptidase [Thermoplasmata archaeon]
MTPPQGAPASLGRYAAATAVTVAAILSQYAVPELLPALRPVYGSLAGSLLIVYGLPILAFAVLVGRGPLAGWSGRMVRAFDVGLRSYGVLSLLALLGTILILLVILAVDPGAVSVLSAPTPVVKAAEADPYFWVALSFPIGVFEELIFRGWIFGYWLKRDPARWKLHALWTSALFAGMHLYYALTYGVLFVIPALLLLLDGGAFAITVRESGGNLVAVSFLHGWNDATVFLALALPSVGLTLHYAVILLGGALALALYFRRKQREADGTALRPIGSEPVGPPVSRLYP